MDDTMHTPEPVQLRLGVPKTTPAITSRRSERNAWEVFASIFAMDAMINRFFCGYTMVVSTIIESVGCELAGKC
jgi:hypothetical protein